MRKIISNFIVILFSSLVFLSCDSDDTVESNSPLVGSWNLTEMRITYQGSSYTYLPHEIGLSQTLIINANGTYSAISTTPHGTQTETGTWEYSESTLTKTSDGETMLMPCTISGNVLSITFEQGVPSFDIGGIVIMIYQLN